MGQVNVPATYPKWAPAWARALPFVAGWGQGQGRQEDTGVSLVSTGANWDITRGPEPDPFLFGHPRGDVRGADFNAYLSNVIPDRAGRTLTFWAAKDGALRYGALAPYIEFDAPSVQVTIRRGTVLSDPYLAELQRLGVVGKGVPATPPPWTYQGWLYYHGLNAMQNAPGRRG